MSAAETCRAITKQRSRQHHPINLKPVDQLPRDQPHPIAVLWLDPLAVDHEVLGVPPPPGLGELGTSERPWGVCVR